MAINCPYLHADGLCEIATKLASDKTYILDENEQTCRTCQDQPQPMAVNLVTVSLGIANAKRRGRGNAQNLITTHPHYLRRPTDGPGAALECFFIAKGETESTTCLCGPRITQMNDWGIAGCLTHIGEIVSWIKEEGRNRRKEVWEPGAVALIRSSVAVVSELDYVTPVNVVLWSERNVSRIAAWITATNHVLGLATPVIVSRVRQEVSEAKQRLGIKENGR